MARDIVIKGGKMKLDLHEGILNVQLKKVLAATGHMDWLMLSDSAMPVPVEKERVDLAIVPGLPRQLEVLKAILNEKPIEKIYIASQIKEVSPKYLSKIQKMLDDIGIPLEFVPHDELKKMSRDYNTRACIRTGECTSYSTMILQCGVSYGGDDQTDFEP